MQTKLIRGATVATSSQSFVGDVLVQGEKIAQVGRALPAPPGTEVIDAAGLLLLPGGVDAHTHFDLDVGFTRASDDFYTGSVAAACGGTTTVIDHMAFGPAGCPLTHQPGVYRELAKDCVIDYGLHGVVQHVNDDVLRDMQALRDMGISSVKIYLTYDYRLDAGAALAVLCRAKELDMVVCAHCEDHGTVTRLRAEFVSEGKTQAKYHPLSRPAQAEAASVRQFLELARQAGECRVLVVHLSSAEGLDALRAARAKGVDFIFSETCPQYLLLDDSCYNDPKEGLKYIMSPPLRKAGDEAALWQAVAGGEIDTIGTDHCPFFFRTQKQRGKDDFTKCPGGAPGVELRMSLLLSEGVLKGRLDLPQMVQLCSRNPADLFGLRGRKGDIAAGYDADLVLFDPGAKWTVTQRLLHERVDYTPYEGMQLTGRPVMTLSRGEVLVKEGQFLGEKGRGNYLSRNA